MLQRKILTFRHKAILTVSMLEELYNYPREFVRLKYRDLSDGIIFGLDYSLENGELILSEGAVKHDGEIYFLPEDLNISELVEQNNLVADRKYFLALTKGQPLRHEPCLTEFPLFVSFLEEKNSDDFATLGEFIFRGATRFNLPELSDEKDPFENIFRASSFNLLDVPFAAQDKATFHPKIFRIIKKFLQIKPRKTFYDFALVTFLQNSPVLSIETLSNYILEAGGKKSFGTRRELLRTFCDSLLKTEFRPIQANSSAQKENSAQSSRPLRKLL